MVVAYCVMSHTAPAQVLRLARTLRAGSPGARVLVHHDPTGPPLDRSAAAGVERVVAEPVQWGRSTQLDALLRLLDHGVSRTDADWLVLLSGQDYPARPIRAIEADLAATAVDGYVDGDVVTPRFERSGTDEWTRRYFCRWHEAPALTGVGRRAVAALRPGLFLRDLPSGTLLGRRLHRTPFGSDRPCRVGQDWLTLSRRAAEALLDAPEELLRHFRGTLAPTESFPHTVLHAHPGLRLAGGGRRFVRFDPGAPSPRTLGVADLDAILRSGADFARKFAPDDPVLDRIDAAIDREPT